MWQERQLAATPHSASSASTPSVGIMSDSNASTPVIHGRVRNLCPEPLRLASPTAPTHRFTVPSSTPRRLNPPGLSPPPSRAFGRGPTPHRGRDASLEAALARQQEEASGSASVPNMRLDEFAVRPGSPRHLSALFSSPRIRCC